MNHLLPKKPMLALLLALAALIVPTSKTSAGDDLYYGVLRSTGAVIVDMKDRRGMGTCWLLDVERRLVVTNAHVVALRRGLDALRVVFPLYQDGQVLREPAAYGVPGLGIPASVLYVDKRHDLALLQLDRVPEGLTALPLARRGPRPGEMVSAIGAYTPKRDGLLWQFRRGRVAKIGYMHLQCKTVRYTATVYDKRPAQSPLSATTLIFARPTGEHGDSGGPMINEQGELVGITVVAAVLNDGTGKCAGAIHVREIRKFLDRVLEGKTAQPVIRRAPPVRRPAPASC